jgi:hypothetical protein
MTVYVVRAFITFRETLASNEQLERKLRDLERSLIALNLTTHRRFREVYDAIRALQAEPAPKQRPIGFTADRE